jgi:hypothetical protein
MRQVSGFLCVCRFAPSSCELLPSHAMHMLLSSIVSSSNPRHLGTWTSRYWLGHLGTRFWTFLYWPGHPIISLRLGFRRNFLSVLHPNLVSSPIKGILEILNLTNRCIPMDILAWTVHFSILFQKQIHFRHRIYFLQVLYFIYFYYKMYQYYSVLSFSRISAKGLFSNLFTVTYQSKTSQYMT